MEEDSVGAQLRDTRLAKRLSVEQVSGDTFISVRLIRALESEQYDEFSSEIYLVGMLKSYAEYLGLDGTQIIQRFRNMRIQEQETPMAELLKKEPPMRRKVIIMIIAILVVLGGAGVIVWRVFPEFINSIGFGQEQSGARQEAAGTEETEESVVYQLKDDFLEREVGVEDTIDLSTDGVQYRMVVGRIARRVTLVTLGGRVRLQTNERVVLPIDPTTDTQAEVTVQRIFRDRSPPAVRLRVVRRQGNGAAGIAEAQAEIADDKYGNTTIASRKQTPIDLERLSTATPTFPVQISFTAPVFLEYQVDGGGQVAQVYSAQDTVELNPRQTLGVWVTNAGAVLFQLDGRFIPIGDAGEVTSFLIEKGVNTSENQDTLRVVPLY